MTFNLNRRHVVLGAGALALTSAGARAQAYPSKSIRMVVPLSAASTGDIVARRISDALAAELGQAFVVENLPGAGGVPATAQIARAPKDGYVLGVVSSNHVVAPSVVANIGYDAVKDFTWLSVVGESPFVLAVPATSPARSVKDLIALAKAKPGDITYGSSGNGTVLHLAAVMFANQANIDLKHVPYKGLAPAVNDLLGGTIDALFTAYGPVAGHVQSGKVRLLAISTKTRDPALPELPTLSESGLTDYDYKGWIALIGPADLPKDVSDRMTVALKSVLSKADIREALARSGVNVVGSDPATSATFVARDYARQTELVKLSGAKVE